MHSLKSVTSVIALLGRASPVLSLPNLDEKSVTFEDFGVSTHDDGDKKSPDWAVWTLSGVGIASLAVGISLYSVGQADQSSLETAERDDQGRIRSVTQRRAFRLDIDASDRLGSGTGFMVAGAILGGAAALWYVYGQESEALPNPSENQIVPFGYMPKFEMHVSRDVWQLSGQVLF